MVLEIGHAASVLIDNLSVFNDTQSAPWRSWPSPLLEQFVYLLRERVVRSRAGTLSRHCKFNGEDQKYRNELFHCHILFHDDDTHLGAGLPDDNGPWSDLNFGQHPGDELSGGRACRVRAMTTERLQPGS